MWPEGAQHITKTTKRPLTAGTLFQRSMTELVITLQKKGEVITIKFSLLMSTHYQKTH